MVGDLGFMFDFLCLVGKAAVSCFMTCVHGPILITEDANFFEAFIIGSGLEVGLLDGAPEQCSPAQSCSRFVSDFRVSGPLHRPHLASAAIPLTESLPLRSPPLPLPSGFREDCHP